ncbi:F0F1 ATP synthase subunit delta [secondary endosymbiont of Ctenarytaina eucalypti]|uniref:ATP synthase subunit delta n=1 Tax=secondary endosymbiont of Ctenarytaina eucalypti TaxID=1199245 RepID=J3TFK4_9ENTR|nr:F0F1 ATP synthase subunit delta [secondary endosymbiont of Ctenarytaina eucalypti]AFP85032.1 ATP synthase, F1 delta subunit [secondary endosymbiont of Ctenarytaina eucalypti]
MSELVTVARPYAKAAFDFAVEHQDVAHWQAMLEFSSAVSRNEQIAALLSGTALPEKLAEIFLAVCEKNIDAFFQSLIRIMSENKRLAALPNVLEHFILFRAAQDAVVEVNVISAYALQEEQLVKMSTALEQRLARTVKLNCKIDKYIIAGIVIHIGDVVIDESVRGRLDRLKDILQS